MAGKIRECKNCGLQAGESDTSCPRCGHTSFTKRVPPPAPKPAPPPPAAPPAAGRIPPVAARRPVVAPPSPAWLGLQVFFFAGIVAGLLGVVIGGMFGAAIGGVISAASGWIASLLRWTTWDDYAQVWLRPVWLLSAWMVFINISLRCSRYFIENIASSSSTSGWRLARDFRFAWLIPLALIWVGTLLLFLPSEWTRVVNARSAEARQSIELVNSGEQSLRNRTAQWQNISEAVDKFLQAIRLWPANSKAKAELEKSCEKLIEAAEREFYKENAALARDLFSQARRITADPAKVNSSEQRLYHFTEIRAPAGAWSQPVALDQCPAVEFYSEIPLYVSDADSERLIAETPPDPISFRGTSVRLQSASGQDCLVGVFFLVASRNSTQDLILQLNFLAPPSTRARFFVDGPFLDGHKVLKAEPVVSGSQEWPATTPPTPSGSQPVKGTKGHPIRIPELQNYKNRPIADVWLYGDFSFRGWEGSTGYFNTGFPAAGSTRVEIEFAGGIWVSDAIQKRLNRRDKVRFRVGKSESIKVLSVQTNRDGILVVRAISPGRLSL